MKSYLRAVRLVFHYPMTLGAAIACSLLVAVLWGGNIGALYPILEITFDGQSLQSWVREEIQNGQQRSADLLATIEELEAQVKIVPDPQRLRLKSEIDKQRLQWRAEQKSLAVKHRLRPWIDRCLPDDPFSTVAVIVLLLLLATAVKDLCLVANISLVGYLSELVVLHLRKDYHEHVLAMDPATFDKRGASPLATLCDRGIEAIGNGLRSLLGNAIREPLKMIACLIGAAFISWRLLLLAMILAPVSVLAIRWLAHKVRRECSAALQDDLMLSAVLIETYGGLPTVQAYTMESHENTRFRRVCHRLLRKVVRIGFWSSLAKPAAELIGIAAVGIAILSGAYLVLNQETELLGITICERPLSLPTLLVFYGMLIGMNDPARKLSDVFGSIQVGVAAAVRVYGVLDQPLRIADPSEPIALPAVHRRLVIDGVSFQYTPQQPVLRDISLSIEFGETLAVVGPNGCGKSTLANLIPRFHDPIEGSVRMDDIDLRRASLKDLRNRIGLVTQQTFLFNDTVLENIRYGSPSATDDEVRQASHQAGAHEFIESSLERGYDTIVGPNGNRLSGGQRQRLSLARALLKDPDILILDEATSQVDPHSEQLIQRAIEQSAGRRTTIIITHRSSTLGLADRILVMDSGRIAGLGTHDQLLANCPVYGRLFGNVILKQSA